MAVYFPDEKVRFIVVHYSATPIERPYLPHQLERDHVSRGFKGVGYHYYFPRSGGRIPYRDLTKPGMVQEGAHVRGYNDQSIGLCYEGGLTLQDMEHGRNTMTKDQEREIIATIKELLERFPRAMVVGHRDLGATQCPGFDVSQWWQRVQDPWWVRMIKNFLGDEG